MKTNVGSKDRIIRLVVGGALVSSSVFAHGTLRWVALSVGAILVGTAFIAFCPAYWLLRLRTAPASSLEGHR